MRRWLAALSIGWVSVSGGTALAATYLDDGGRPFTIEGPARRIVTLAPSLTELVYAVGAGDALVGTDRSSDFPPQANALPRIGDHARFDIERIVALQPDLILAWRHGNPSRELAQLDALGLPVFHLEPRRLADVPRALERLGALVGREGQGRSAALRLQTELDALRAEFGARRPVAVFYQVWREPLLTLNADHLISDVIGLCGGRNLFGDLPQLVPQLSLEAVIASRPEAILAARSAKGGGGFRRDGDHPALIGWRRFGSIPAVRGGRLYTIAGDTISRQGPRIAQGARAVCEAIDAARSDQPER